MSSQSVTEAACLLEQGALYRQRIALKRHEPGGDLIFAGVKTGAFSVYSGDQPYFHFDLDGRWQRAFVSDVHYLKGLDGSVRAIDRVREGDALLLDRRTLSYAEATDLDGLIRSFILNLTADLDAGRLSRVNPPDTGKVTPLAPDALHDLLDRITAWDAAAWFAQRERYLSTYGPLPLVPPDCQNAIVLQATLGNASGRAFGLAPAAEFYARTPLEFEQHVRDVSRLLGRRMAECRTVLILGADLFQQPVDAILKYFEIAKCAYVDCHEISTTENNLSTLSRPFHAIIDHFPSSIPDIEIWQRLRQLGLTRVTLEVESGDRNIRALFNSNWEDRALIETARALKTAEIGISVLTIVSPTGRERAEAHVERTVGLIQSLELTGGDFVFLLDEREIVDPTSTANSRALISEVEWKEQLQRLRTGFIPLKSRGTKVLPYTLEKQRK